MIPPVILRVKIISHNGRKHFHSFPSALPVSPAIFPRKLGTAVKIREVTTGGAAWPGTDGRKEGVAGRAPNGQAVTSLLFWGLSKPRRRTCTWAGKITSGRFGDSCLG